MIDLEELAHEIANMVRALPDEQLLALVRHRLGASSPPATKPRPKKRARTAPVALVLAALPPSPPEDLVPPPPPSQTRVVAFWKPPVPEREFTCRHCQCPLRESEIDLRECHAMDGGICQAAPHRSHAFPLQRGHCGVCDVYIDSAAAREPCIPPPPEPEPPSEPPAPAPAPVHDAPPNGACEAPEGDVGRLDVAVHDPPPAAKASAGEDDVPGLEIAVDGAAPAEAPPKKKRARRAQSEGTPSRETRGRRRRVVRARTINVSRISKRELELERARNPDADVRRLPLLRADCESAERPCPFVSCAHHLFLDVLPNGSIKLNFPDLLEDAGGIRFEEMPATCALDIAAKGGASIDRVGEVLNITRERVRQVEEKVRARTKKRNPKLKELLG